MNEDVPIHLRGVLVLDKQLRQRLDVSALVRALLKRLPANE